VLRQVFEFSPGFSLAAKLTVDQSQPRAPGGGDPVLLHKVLDHRLQLLETALFPADAEHLKAKSALVGVPEKAYVIDFIGFMFTKA
jgi:hypothetical protein